jgi:hypothetical protein
MLVDSPNALTLPANAANEFMPEHRLSKLETSSLEDWLLSELE